MTAAIYRADLLSALSFVAPTRGNARTFPVLGCARIDDGRITTTDLEVTSVAPIDSDVSVCVDAKRLLDVIRLTDADDVRLSVDAAYTMVIDAGGASTKLFGFPVIDFPVTAEPDWTDATVLTDVNRKALSVVLKSADDTYGVFVRASGDALTLAATNGDRLAVATINRTSGGDWSAIVPTAGVRAMSMLRAIARVAYAGNNLWVEGDGGTLAIRTRDSKFPDVLTFITTKLPSKSIVDSGQFNDAIGRALIMAGDDAIVTLHIGEGRVSVAGQANEGALGIYGSAIDEIPAEHDGGLTAAFNGGYLRDCLSVFNHGSMTIGFGTKTGYIRLRPDAADLVYVVMPRTR